jgi:hypothetical protein
VPAEIDAKWTRDRLSGILGPAPRDAKGAQLPRVEYTTGCAPRVGPALKLEPSLAKPGEEDFQVLIRSNAANAAPGVGGGDLPLRPPLSMIEQRCRHRPGLFPPSADTDLGVGTSQSLGLRSIEVAPTTTVRQSARGTTVSTVASRAVSWGGGGKNRSFAATTGDPGYCPGREDISQGRPNPRIPHHPYWRCLAGARCIRICRCDI